MPSIFGHGLVGLVGAYLPIQEFKKFPFKKLIILSFLCANLPDFDVLFRYIGMDQSGFFGHRNFFHSITFALITALLFGFFSFFNETKNMKFKLSFFFFILIMSHNLLDALTLNVGVAFFYPFMTEQITFPITPLLPAGFNWKDFTVQGTLLREFLLLWIPCLLLIFIFKWERNRG